MKVISVSALLFFAATATEAAQLTATCEIAIKALSAHLPELTARAPGYEWRGLPTELHCDSEGGVQSVTLHWREGRGLLSDARSAIAALGARLTGDTATAIRGAFDRCLTAGGRLGEPHEVATGRTSISCTIASGETLVTVSRRGER
jgi:hypothetical protein